MMDATQLQDASDQQLLVDWAQHRNEFSLTALIDRHRGLVYGAANTLAGSAAADDVAQAVFLLLTRKATKVAKRNGPVADWLLATCRRVAANQRRADQRRRRREGLVANATPSATTDTSDLPTDQLLEAIDALPLRLREAVVLHHLEGIERAVAADQLGVSPATLEKRLQRALSALRESLARRGFTITATTLIATLATTAQSQAAPAALTITAATLTPAPSVAALAHNGNLTMTAILLPVAATLTIAVGAVAAIPIATEPTPVPIGNHETGDHHNNAALVYYQHIIHESTLNKFPESVNQLHARLFTDIINDQAFENLEHIDQWPERRDALLGALARGADMPTAEWGRDLSQGPNLNLPDLASYREWGRAAITEAVRLHRKQDHQACSEILIDVSALARHLQRDQILVTRLVGISLDNHCHQAYLNLSLQWPNELRVRTADALAALPATPPLSHAITGERSLLNWMRDRWATLESREEKNNFLTSLAGATEPTALIDKASRAFRLAAIIHTFEQDLEQVATLYDQLEAILDNPSPTRQVRIDALEDKVSEAGDLARLLMPSMNLVSVADLKSEAMTHVVDYCLRNKLDISKGQIWTMDISEDQKWTMKKGLQVTLTDGKLSIKWVETGLSHEFTIMSKINRLNEGGPVPTPVTPTQPAGADGF